MSFLPSNKTTPVIHPVRTSYVVDQPEAAVESPLQTHPLAPPPLGPVRAGVSRTPVRSTPAIEPSSPSITSQTPQENQVRPEGKQGAPSCQKQELNEALASPLLKKSTRGVVKPRKKVARVRRTWSSSTGVMPRRTWSSSTGVMPLNQPSVVESTALVPYKKETVLVPYKKPSPNLRAKVGPVLKDIVLSLAVEQLPEICCPALPAPRGPAYKAMPRMLASTSLKMGAAPRPRTNHFQQVRKTTAQIVAGNSYTVTETSTKPTRVGQTLKGVTAATPIMSGVYVAQTDIVVALTRYYHQKPYLLRQKKVVECIENAGRVETDFNRNLKKIQTSFEQINEAFNSPDALNQANDLPKLMFPRTNSNQAGLNPQDQQELFRKKLDEALENEVIYQKQLDQTELDEEGKTRLEGLLQHAKEQRTYFQSLVFGQGQPQNVGIAEAQNRTLRPAFLALMNQQCDKFGVMFAQKMHLYENEKQVVPVKYILGLNPEVFESVRKISETLDGILCPLKQHKASLTRQGQITNHPHYTAYEMKAEEVHQLQECIEKFGSFLTTFEANVENTNTHCEDFERFDQDVTKAIQAVAANKTVDASTMQNYDDLFIRDVKNTEEDWRQMPTYCSLKGRFDRFLNGDETKLAIICVHRNKPFVVVKPRASGPSVKSGLIKGAITGAVVYGIKTFAPDPIQWGVQKLREPIPKKLPTHHALFAQVGRGMLGALGAVGGYWTLYGVHFALKSFQCAQNIKHWHNILTSAEKFFNTAEGRKLQNEIYANFAKSLFNSGAKAVKQLPVPPGGGGPVPPGGGGPVPPGGGG